ncbi:hypothetical protein E3O45_03260 [Cryobacterium sp. TMS1-20-1]|uniref:hypothetical protein n=1 Tax=Cryobacterium sp. TMS1-20-1 TaxID=1259223 RepID=UPI00106AECBA|nr:hypothetical protein [Cryobacterium sp. TMS1-20-1]TFC80159.1 hypothetical protein E3O45_03260 [Cryobacterium sp. TMS1-20-1]
MTITHITQLRALRIGFLTELEPTFIATVDLAAVANGQSSPPPPPPRTDSTEPAIHTATARQTQRKIRRTRDT